VFIRIGAFLVKYGTCILSAVFYSVSGLSLVDAYKSSDLHNQTNANLEAMIHQQQLDDDRKADEHKQSVTYATNFLFQTWICMKRAATNVARDPQLSIFRVMSILERLGVKDGPM
jgi:hypothetical protein